MQPSGEAAAMEGGGLQVCGLGAGALGLAGGGFQQGPGGALGVEVGMQTASANHACDCVGWEGWTPEDW